MKFFKKNNFSGALNLKFTDDKQWLFFSYILIVAGCFLRLWQYLQNRSLWQDEIVLSSSLVRMNFTELATLPLDYEQKAPLGYLWASKACLLLFGNGDMALRLFPLICGLAALLLFLPVCRYFLKSYTALSVAVGIIALASPLVYHTVEAKQYSTELFGTVLSIYLYILYYKKTNLKSLLLWGISGAVIIWFCFSSIFVLAGIAGGVSLSHLQRKDWRHLLLSMIPFLIWMFSFGLSYIFIASHHSGSEWLVDWFRDRGGFLPPGIFAGLNWLMGKPLILLNFPLGLTWANSVIHANIILRILSFMVVIPLILWLLGMVYSFQNNRRTFFILFFPIVLHLVATALVIYPFFERLTVYLAPFLALFIALGCEKFLSFFPSYRSAFLMRANIMESNVGSTVNESDSGVSSIPSFAALPGMISKLRIDVLIVFLVLAGAVRQSAKDLIYPDLFGGAKHWHQRELYEYLHAKYKKGDVVYVYWNAGSQFKYYNYVSDYKFNFVEAKDTRFSSGDLDSYLDKMRADLEKLKSHKRIWIVCRNALSNRMGPNPGQPYWYYNSKDHLLRRQQLFRSLGTAIDSMKTRENINITLLETTK